MNIHRVLFLICGVLSIFVPSSAKECWHAFTGNNYIQMSDIECLVSTDGNPCFTVLLKDGKMVTDIESLSFVLKEPEGAGISDNIMAEPKVIVSHNVISISNAAVGSTVSVLTVDGNTLVSTVTDSTSHSIDISSLNPGTYLLNVNGKPLKFVKQ